jgi:hypothetical protein
MLQLIDGLLIGLGAAALSLALFVLMFAPAMWLYERFARDARLVMGLKKHAETGDPADRAGPAKWERVDIGRRAKVMVALTALGSIFLSAYWFSGLFRIARVLHDRF